MAYAFVQQNANDAAATATTITVTLTPTAGNLLVFALSGDSADTTSIALSDNLGTHNTFTQIGTDLVTGSAQRCAWWLAANCKGGATTFTATFSATTRFRTIYVAEYSGIATTSPFLNGARAESAAPGTGVDAVSSGNANATSQPALVWGFGTDIDGGTTPTAGTGFTSRTAVWSTATSLGRPEDKRVTATGNVAATFTATTGADDHAAAVGVFAEAAAAPTLAGWAPGFPDRVPSRPSVGALGVAVAPVLAIALSPLSWSPGFPDSAPGRSVPNLATGSAAEPVFVPPAAPAVTPMSWSPSYPDQLRRARAAPIEGGSFAPAATLPNAPAPPMSWSPSFPDAAPRPRAPIVEGGAGAPVAPNPIPSVASWAAAVVDSVPRARGQQVPGGGAAPALPIPNPPPSIFPLTVAPSGRHLRKIDGTPFLICADSTWSLLVNVPLASIGTYLTTIASQGFTAVMGNAIEHHYTLVKPPKERSGLLPFTQRLDGSSYTGSPNGTNGAAGTQGQFAGDPYSNINTQSPDWTFINNSYWLNIEAILDACLQASIAIFVWPAYLGFQANDEGWLNEMVALDAVTGAGGFTGQSFADPTKQKTWNYGAWLAARWKNYPHIIWVMGGDYGTHANSLTTAQRSAVNNVMAGLKSVAGQQSTLFTAHWDRPCVSTDVTLAAGSWDLNLTYCGEEVAETTRLGYAATPAIPAFLGEYFYEGSLFGGSTPFRKYLYWGFLSGVAGGFYGHEQLWRFDTGSPGTDWTTLLSTTARNDAARQFAFWKSKPWHRLKPSGLGGMGTIVTAGGGTASPQTTDYVAAAATPEGDLLLAYVPPAHSGSVTIDMTKMAAAATARWFDPTNSAFTSIGTIASTGTHAFTVPGTNSAGDADFILVLEAPIPLSWGPSFPDRAPRQSLTTAQVVSGQVAPVALLPNPLLSSWAPGSPDSALARRQIITGGETAPILLPAAPVPALAWAPSFPDRAPGPTRPITGGMAAPEMVLPNATVPAMSWLPAFPDGTARARAAVIAGGAAGPVVALPNAPAPQMSWSPTFPDRTPRARAALIAGGATAPDATIPNPPAPALSWSPSFADFAPRALAPLIAGGMTGPDATIPGPAVDSGALSQLRCSLQRSGRLYALLQLRGATMIDLIGPITVEQGDDVDLLITITDDAGARVDLSGFTIELQVKPALGAPDPATIAKSTADGSIVPLNQADPTTRGLATCAISSAETNITPRLYWLDLVTISPSGKRHHPIAPREFTIAGVVNPP